jgi:hypothetical protein
MCRVNSCKASDNNNKINDNNKLKINILFNFEFLGLSVKVVINKLNIIL